MAFTRGFPTRGFPARSISAGWAHGTAVAHSWWPGGASGDPYMRLWATDAAGALSEYDLTTYGIHVKKLTIGYNQPRRLEMTIGAAQHTRPLPQYAKIFLVDESYGYWGTPIFEGFVEEIAPTSTLELGYTCYCPMRRAAHEVYVMSAPWTLVATVPTEGSGSVPHLVFNVKNDHDEDAAHSRNNDASVAVMAQTILDDAAAYLRTIMAAPVDTGDTPYVSADTTGAVFIPQSKVSMGNQTVPNALNQILQIDPRFRVTLQPGENDRHWRIRDVTTATQLTLTLNSTSAAKKVLSLNLMRSLDRRYGAVKIYGPRKAIIATFSTADASLTEGWNGTEEGFFLSFGPESTISVGDCGKVWQITDATKRNLASRLPSDGLVPAPDGWGIELARTRDLTLLVSFDGGDTFRAVPGAKVNLTTGTVTAPNPIYQYTATPPTYTLPDEVRLLAAYYDTPLTVRYPTTAGTFSGTAYSETGRKIEMKVQDIGLAIGFENGVPVAEATRTAQFQEVAQRLQEAYKDIAFSGGCVIDGIDYDFLNLNYRINFAGVDGDGSALTTGWESINAVLTDVEYDFETQNTILTFASDQLDYLQVDESVLKEQLKIDAKQWSVDYGPMITLDYGKGAFSKFFAGSGDDSNDMGQNDSAYAPKLDAVNDASNYAGQSGFNGSGAGEGFAPASQGPQAWGSVLDTHNPGQQPSKPSPPGKAFKTGPQAIAATEGSVVTNPLYGEDI